MMVSNPVQPAAQSIETVRYGAGAIAFHWVMFLLVVGVGTLGLLHDSWPKRTQSFWINVHAMFASCGAFGTRRRRCRRMRESFRAVYRVPCT
jgi:cytochrome b561